MQLCNNIQLEHHGAFYWNVTKYKQSIFFLLESWFTDSLEFDNTVSSCYQSHPVKFVPFAEEQPNHNPFYSKYMVTNNRSSSLKYAN